MENKGKEINEVKQKKQKRKDYTTYQVFCAAIAYLYMYIL